MILLITFLVGVLSFVYFYLVTKRKVQLAEQFPGPEAHPIFGNIFNFTFDDTLEAKRKTIEGHRKYGDIFRITLIRDYQFMVCDPKVYEKVLSSTTQNLKKHVVYEFLSPWLRNGLIISSAQYWQKHRKIITPAFHFKILEQFIEVFDRQCMVMIDKLAKHADGSVVNLVDYVALMALDIINETAMGTHGNAQTNSDSEYVKAIESITGLLTKRFTSIWRRFDILYAIFGYKEKREQQKCIRIIHEFAYQIIEKRRDYLIQQQNLTATVNENGLTSNNADNDDDAQRSKKMVFLDVLLQAKIDGKPLNNDEIIEETNTFMFAGHDTTTIATCSMLFALSRHKHVQDKVLAEIVSIFGANANAPITYRQLNELKYMDLVIKESLRFYPAVPAIGRYIDHDIVLGKYYHGMPNLPENISASIILTGPFQAERLVTYFQSYDPILPEEIEPVVCFQRHYLHFNDGKIIPAGVNVTFNMDITFHDPKYFKDPHIFDPERFADSSTEKRSSFVYIPFSAGLRNCIGQKYAQLDLKVVITRMLLSFELVPAGEEPIITNEIVSRSLNGVQVGLKPRIF